MGETKKKPYKKPTVKKENSMQFPTEIISASNKKVVCRQCAGCHGCR